MKCALSVLTAFFLLPLCISASAQDRERTPARQSAGIAIRAGHLFDAKSGQLLANQIILVRGEKIQSVGPADRIQIPSEDRVIDLSNATVLPGLIDAHTHIFSSLSSGARVTTSREAWTLMALENAQSTLRA